MDKWQCSAVFIAWVILHYIVESLCTNYTDVPNEVLTKMKHEAKQTEPTIKYNKKKTMFTGLISRLSLWLSGLNH